MRSFIKKAFTIATVMATIVGLSPLLKLSLRTQLAIIIAAVVILVIWYWRDITSLGSNPLQKVKKFSTRHDHLIFVYGSLLVRDSLSRTIARNPSEMECIPAYLNGHKIQWGAFSERHELLDKHVHSIQDGSVWASLTAAKGEPNDKVPGAIIGVSNLGYVALRNRERHYILKDVTSSITLLGDGYELPGKRIMAFLPKNETVAKEPNQTCFIRRQYFNNISSVLKKLGFKGLSVPPGLQLRTAYLVNEQIERILRTRYGERALLKVQKAVASDLNIAKETRSIAYSLRPIVLPRLQYDEIVRAAEATVSLSTKALKILNQNSSLALWAKYRDKDIKFLHLAEQRGELTPTISRVDMALAGNRLLILELNADSPGGMRHLDILSAKQSDVLKHYKRLRWINGQAYDTSEKTVNALVHAGPDGRPNKRAVILEYHPEDWPTYPEMLFFKETLEGRGIKTEIVDLATHSLECRDNNLFLTDGSLPIDLVYKRILWNDLLKSHEGAERALTDVYLHNCATIVNSLGSRMAGNKMIMAMMKAPEFTGWLSEIGENLTGQEQTLLENHIPYTCVWGDTPDEPMWTQSDYLKREVIDEPYRFVLKSYHGYGGHEVVIGCEEERPKAAFEDLWNKGYIAQEYVPHGRALMPRFRHGKVDWEYHFYILGAYVIDGKCVAIEAKTSSTLPINMTKKALRTAVFPTI
jgi:glutathionylspermidine synthase